MEGSGTPEDPDGLGELQRTARGSDILNRPGGMTSPSRARLGCRAGGRNWADHGVDENAG